MNNRLDQSILCPECGASNRPSVSNCWLCGSNLRSEPRQRGDETTEIIDAELVPEYARSRFQFSIMSTLLLVTLVAIGLGTAKLWPQLSGLVLVVGCPALIATIIRCSRQESRGKQVTLGSRILTFFVSSAIILGLFILIAFAAFAGLIILCFYQVFRGGLNI